MEERRNGRRLRRAASAWLTMTAATCLMAPAVHGAVLEPLQRVGVPPGNGVTDLHVSPNGNTLLYRTRAPDGGAHTYAYDTASSTVRHVRADVTYAPTWARIISADGRRIAFQSTRDDLVPDDGNGVPDTFVLDVFSGALQRASTGPAQTDPVALSADGRFLVMRSADSEIVRDLEAGASHSVPVGDAGRIAPDVRFRRTVEVACGPRCNPVYVTYDRVTGERTTSSSSHPPQEDGYATVIDGDPVAIHRRFGSTRVRVSASSEEPAGHVSLARLSADGSTVAFVVEDRPQQVFTRRIIWDWPSHKLRSANGLCATGGTGHSLQDGLHVSIWGCAASGQDFALRSDGTLRVDGKCLDAVDGGTANGTRVQLWACHGGGNQRWRPHADGTVRNVAAGRCLDIVDGSVDNGTPLQLWDCHGEWNQRWRVPPPTGPVSGLAGKCLDAAGAEWRDGTAVQLYACNGTQAQDWTAYDDGTIRALGRCLDVRAAGTANGTRVQLWSCNGSGAQQWRSQPDGTFENPQSGRCLDVLDHRSADGTPTQLWDCAGTANQRWALPRID